MENGASSLLSAEDNAAFYSAQFEDACAFLASVAGPSSASSAASAACAAWSDSIMLAGINSAIAEYAAKARLMTDRRIRARVFNASGVGRIVNAASYDYSVSICEMTPEACSVYEYDGLMQIGEDGVPIPQGPSPGVNLWGVGDVTQEWLDGGGAELLAHNSTPYSVPVELNSPTFRWLEQANSLYLAPAFKAFRSIYLRTGITAIDDCLLFLNLLVPTFLTSFVRTRARARPFASALHCAFNPCLPSRAASHC